jgi:hypothetical protein
VDHDRFDQLTRVLATPSSRRTALRRIAALAAGGLLAGRGMTTIAAPKADKPTKCYGAGSHCTNGKQCCSGVCTNRQCAGDGTVCTPLTCPALGYTCGSHSDGCSGTLQCGECVSDACTTRECVAGQCNAASISCDDGNPCTIDSCDPNSGCVHTPLPEIGQICSTGKLGICAAGTIVCDDDGDLVCVQNEQPRTETCNGLDDNCNGVVDDGACPPLPQASTRCQGDVCVIDQCHPGFGNCDGNDLNGCETSLQSNLNHCGTCGNVCPGRPNAVPTCIGGQCGIQCQSGFGNCDGNPLNGCEANFASDPAHCGFCGRSCPSGAVCRFGQCCVPAPGVPQPGAPCCGSTVGGVCVS